MSPSTGDRPHSLQPRSPRARRSGAPWRHRRSRARAPWAAPALISSGLGLACLLGSPTPAAGQDDGLWLEFSAGVSVPTQEFGDIDRNCPLGSTRCPIPTQTGAGTGLGFGARLGYA